jgi:hypothetical protein
VISVMQTHWIIESGLLAIIAGILAYQVFCKDK